MASLGPSTTRRDGVLGEMHALERGRQLADLPSERVGGGEAEGAVGVAHSRHDVALAARVREALAQCEGGRLDGRARRRDRRRRRLVSAAIGMTSCRRAAGRPRG